MKKLVLILFLLFSLGFYASAAELTAPPAPDYAEDLLPADRDSFAEGLWYVVRSALAQIRPDIGQVTAICLSLVGVVLLISMLRTYEGPGKAAVDLCGVIVVACILLKPTGALIDLGAATVTDMAEYGKLLLPVMTAALAAQGGTVTAASIYTATAFVISALGSAVSAFLVPMVYIYLLLSVVNGAMGQELVKKLQDLVKWIITWGLKLTLYIFTAYVSITGIISGTTDQAAVKATKLTISGMVPVIGGILSDASETILISAGIVKNAAGIYGMLAIVAIAVGPFLRIGLHYLLLKLTVAVCGVFADKKITGIMEDFSGAMGLLLAMTGTLCLLLLISVVCFLKGVG